MARGDFPSAKQDQFVLRLPDGMRDRLKEAASKNNRSMNSEIVSRLQESLEEKRFLDIGKNELFDDLVDLIAKYVAKDGIARDDRIEARNKFRDRSDDDE